MSYSWFFLPLDLHHLPITFTYEVYLDIILLDLHAKIQVMTLLSFQDFNEKVNNIEIIVLSKTMFGSIEASGVTHAEGFSSRLHPTKIGKCISIVT